MKLRGIDCFELLRIKVERKKLNLAISLLDNSFFLLYIKTFSTYFLSNRINDTAWNYY